MNEEERVNKVKDLRERLFSMRKEREQIIFRKGLMAQDNPDLRENAAYEFLEMKEHSITHRIRRLMQEIHDLVEAGPTGKLK